jgi:polyisoprenoid-binding protein YceI
MKKLIALAIAAAASPPAFAAPETYTIDGTHTLPRFEYNHFGYSSSCRASTRPPAPSPSTAPPRPARWT